MDENFSTPAPGIEIVHLTQVRIPSFSLLPTEPQMIDDIYCMWSMYELGKECNGDFEKFSSLHIK